MDDAGKIHALLMKSLNFDGKPPSEVIAMGMLMRHWLQSEMSDNGKPVDVGAGIGAYDLWVEFGGVELFITIKKAGVQA